MNPWINPWLSLFKSPWSGDVIQDISPVTSWWSPQFEFNFAGNKKVESEVVSNVASYGRQLGILTEAVLELAAGDKGDAVKSLEALAKEIEVIKTKHSATLSKQLRSDLMDLKLKDRDAFDHLIDEVSR